MSFSPPRSARHPEGAPLCKIPPYRAACRGIRPPLPVAGLLLALAWLALAGTGWAADAERRVAAVVEGETIYADELSGRNLRDLRQRLFEAESDAARAAVLQRLREARPEEFPRPDVQVSDEEVARLYEQAGLSDRGSLEDLAGQIRLYLEQQKREAVGEQQLRAAMDAGYVTRFLEPPPGYFLTVADVPAAHSRGAEDAPVTIVEFSDFQCPFCRRALPVVESVLAKHTGKVRLVYRHLPLTQIHPRARELAEAAECAGEQGAFWTYHDLIFDRFSEIDSVDVHALAAEADLSDERRFRQCLEEGRYAHRVAEDLRAAEALGIGGTPSFIVGRRTGNGEITGVLLQGVQTARSFDQAIEQALARNVD